eukprot:371913_1
MAANPTEQYVASIDAGTSSVRVILFTKNVVEALRSKCGFPLSTYFSATKIKWIFENNPNALSLAKKHQLKFGTVDSWLIWNLIGDDTHLIDVSNASRTMLMNLNTLDWDASLCDAFGIPQHILPRIVPSSYDYGIISNGPFKGLPLCGCIGDQQGATLGQMCINPGDVKNTYGTGAFLIFNTGTQPIPSQHGLLTTVLWQLDDDKVVYALEGSVAVAGQAVQFLRDNLGMISNAKECSDLAGSVVDDDDDDTRIYFVTAFSGLYSPYWRTDARGLIYGLTMHTQKKNICRSVLEATCFRTCEIIDAMRQDTKQFGIELNSLKVDGGMTQSDVMLRFQADLLQIPVVRPAMIETTALGAAIVAGLKVQFWDDLDDVKRCVGASKTEFTPSITRDKAIRLKDGWKDAIGRCFKNDAPKKQSTTGSSMGGVYAGVVGVGFVLGVLACKLYLQSTPTKRN